MNYIKSILIFTISIIIYGCSSFPTGSTWEFESKDMNNELDLKVKLTFVDDEKVIYHTVIVQNGKVTLDKKNTTEYIIENDNIKIYNKETKEWEEGKWQLKDDNLLFTAKENDKTIVYKKVK